MQQLPQGGGEAEEAGRLGAADAEPRGRGEGEVPIRGVAVLEPSQGKNDFPPHFPRKMGVFTKNKQLGGFGRSHYFLSPSQIMEFDYWDDYSQYMGK